MASRGGGAAPPYWTEWEWYERRQLLRRQLIDYRGRVLREQFGERPSNQLQDPRYPPPGTALPQPLPQQQGDGGHDTATENYGYGTTGSTGSPQEGGAQPEEMTSPNLYAPQRSVNPSYEDPATFYGGQARYGFPAARNAQSGQGGSFGAPNPQSAPSGHQSYYGSPHQYQSQGNPTQLPRFTPQYPPGQNLQSGHPTQYPSTGEQISDPASPYQQGSGWSTGGDSQYEVHTEQMGSTASHQYRSEQSAVPGFPETYSVPQGSVAPSGLQVNSALPPQEPYSETPSPSAEDETFDSQPATLGGRRQSTYRESRAARSDSIIVESESQRQKLYHNDPDSDATIEIASSSQQRSEHKRTYKPKDSTEEIKVSRSRSRPSVTDTDRSSYYNVDSVSDAADGLRSFSLQASNTGQSIVNQQLYPTSPLQESRKPYKTSSWIPPRGFERPEYNDPAPVLGDMTRTAPSHRRDSDVHRNRRDSRIPKDQPAKVKEEDSGNQDPKRRSDSQLYKDFKVHPSKDFKKGRVLMTYWSEPIGSGATYKGEIGGSIESAGYGETSYNSVRRFVIVKEMQGHCLCVPIYTYCGRATSKPGVKADDHAIIYTGSSAPAELPNEKTLIKKPVRVDYFSGKYRLHPASRVNYSKIYTIEHNFKVIIIGKVHDDSRAIFFTEARRLFDGSDEDEEESKSKKGESESRKKKGGR